MSVDSSEFQPVFTRFRGRIQGPFGLDQLIALNRRGQFGRAHEISVDRLNWSPAATLESVFPPATKKPKALAKSTDLDVTIAINSAEVGPPVPKPAKPVWHYSVGTETYGPITLLELRGLFANGQLTPSDPVWKEGMEDWVPAGELTELQGNLGRLVNQTPSSGSASNYCFACGAATDSRAEICPKCGVRQAPLVAPKSRIVTALFAIFLGTFGIHRFYLGQALLGLCYPIIWCVLASASIIMLNRGEYDVAHLMLGLSSIPAVIAFIEGVVFLCTSDTSFARTHKPG
jgi:hypothetical protein